MYPLFCRDCKNSWIYQLKKHRRALLSGVASQHENPVCCPSRIHTMWTDSLPQQIPFFFTLIQLEAETTKELTTQKKKKKIKQVLFFFFFYLVELHHSSALPAKINKINCLTQIRTQKMVKPKYPFVLSVFFARINYRENTPKKNAVMWRKREAQHHNSG